MSVINNALTTIANKKPGSASTLQPANVAVVTSATKWGWALGGFAMSLALGGWAVSQQENTVVTSLEEPMSISPSTSEQVTPPNQAISPTVKLTPSTTVAVYTEPAKVMAELKPTQMQQKALIVPTEEPTLLVAKVTAPEKKSSESGSLSVKQVSLTPAQLAANAIERGKKELDSNELDAAIKEFETALKYTPSDEETRKRLAALYYGKKQARKSAELLQFGIRLNEESQGLRLALSQILIKESQPEAALGVLEYLPDNAEMDYLAMRAALAQQVKNGEIAFETYQLLVQREPESARWWLGLAIQQERKLMHTEAKHSYQEAIKRVGVSKQTQAFIRDRLKLIDSLEGSTGAN